MLLKALMKADSEVVVDESEVSLGGLGVSKAEGGVLVAEAGGGARVVKAEVVLSKAAVEVYRAEVVLSSAEIELSEAEEAGAGLERDFLEGEEEALHLWCRLLLRVLHNTRLVPNNKYKSFLSTSIPGLL